MIDRVSNYFQYNTLVNYLCVFFFLLKAEMAYVRVNLFLFPLTNITLIIAVFEKHKRIPGLECSQLYNCTKSHSDTISKQRKMHLCRMAQKQLVSDFCCLKPCVRMQNTHPINESHSLRAFTAEHSACALTYTQNVFLRTLRMPMNAEKTMHFSEMTLFDEHFPYFPNENWKITCFSETAISLLFKNRQKYSNKRKHSRTPTLNQLRTNS